jgi:Trypsin-like peptidase domain
MGCMRLHRAFRASGPRLWAAAALLVLLAAGAAAAAPPDHAPANGRDAILAYWTPDRVARAIPRDVAPDRAPGVKPDTQKKGSGGGGTAGTGSLWSGGGLVKKATGKVLFTMGGVDYVCSGSSVNDGSAGNGYSLILTAGHCVYDETGKAFATNWVFAPDYEAGGSIVTSGSTHVITCDTTPWGCWTATGLVTTNAWATGNGSLAGFNADYAFVRVGAGGKSGQANQLDTTVGTQGISFTATPTGATVFAFGYPAASPYDGSKLAYCSGLAVADTFGGSTARGLSCNMTGGSSGGPWFTGFSTATGIGTLTSVNSFKYTAGPGSKYMFGPVFGPLTQSAFNAAAAGPGNKLVS